MRFLPYEVQLNNTSGEAFWNAMRKSLGSKRRFLPEEALAEIACLYAAYENGENSREKMELLREVQV